MTPSPSDGHGQDRRAWNGVSVMRRRVGGFTLIELLVVVAIIAMLISILVPAFSRFRVMSKRTACMSNMRSIGQALQAYLDVNNDYWPYASHMVSIETDPNMRAISDVLASEIRGGREVFLCPADRITETEDPNDLGKTYYETEKTSYEWDLVKAFNGAKRGKDKLGLVKNLGAENVPVLQDWECFHGGKEKTQSTVFLFADLSVRPDDFPVE